MDLLKTLQSLNACHGPAGDETEVADVLGGCMPLTS